MSLRVAEQPLLWNKSFGRRLLLAAISLGALSLAGCGTVSQALSSDLNRKVATPADGSAALAYLRSPVIQAGSAAANVTVHGAAFQQASQLLFDGAAHEATYSSASEMQFSLTASDLASPGRHSVQVQNPGTGVPISNMLALLVTSGYTAFGDSITYGFGLDARTIEAYPYLVATSLSLNVRDFGISGDQACDIFPHAIYGQTVGYTASTAPLYSVMIGTNDADHYGNGSYEAVYNHCHRAVLAWLGTSRADKLLPGDAAFTASGGCSTAPDSQNLGGMTCTAGASGTITAPAFHTTGHPIYVWYTISNTADADATFSVIIDGQTQAAGVSTAPEVPITTYNGSTRSVSVLRLAANAGDHTVAIQTAGGVVLQGIGTNRGGSSIPQLLVGDIPWQLRTNPTASVSTQEQYSADIQTSLAQAQADGLDVRLAQDRLTMFGLASEMLDQLHPSALGHQHLETAYLAAMQ
jgi:hypothetical protein